MANIHYIEPHLSDKSSQLLDQILVKILTCLISCGVEDLSIDFIGIFDQAHFKWNPDSETGLDYEKLVELDRHLTATTKFSEQVKP